MRTLFLALLLAGTAALAQTAPKPSEILNQISRDIVCQCANCGKQTIDQCKHTCSHGMALAAEVKAMIAAGDSRDTILAAMAKQHGEGILAAPSQKSWQGKMAPITPYLLMLLGIIPIIYITRSRHRAAKVRGPKLPVETARDEERLEEALKNFDY